MRVTNVIAITAVMIAAFAPIASQADTVTVTLSGQVIAINAGDVPAAPEISVGDAYTWSFTYNTAAQLGGGTDTIPTSTLTLDSMSWGNGIEGVAQVLHIGATQATVGPFDEYDFEVAQPSGPNLVVNGNLFYTPGTFQWSISASPVLQGDYSTAIVPTAAQLLNAVSTTSSGNDFTTLSWSQEEITGSVTSVQIDGVTTSPVPLPAAGWLLLEGLGGLLAFARVPRYALASN